MSMSGEGVWFLMTAEETAVGVGLAERGRWATTGFRRCTCFKCFWPWRCCFIGICPEIMAPSSQMLHLYCPSGWRTKNKFKVKFKWVNKTNKLIYTCARIRDHGCCGVIWFGRAAGAGNVVRGNKWSVSVGRNRWGSRHSLDFFKGFAMGIFQVLLAHKMLLHRYLASNDDIIVANAALVLSIRLAD